MKKETVKLNTAAMRFVDENCQATVQFKDGNADSPQLHMVAYSGGVIKDHWYWGNLAIDLQGMSFPKKKMPILEDHMTEKKIGFATKMSTDNNQLTVEEATFVDTPESLAFRQNSAAGFPYEASIYVRPTTIERVGEGDTAEVNGYTFKGPGTIWRKSTFKEASVCTFGYDPNTKSVAMSESEEELVIEYNGETKPEASKFKEKEDLPSMNIEKFKTDYPELYAEAVAEGAANAETKFAAEKSVLEEKLSKATDENNKLSQENKETEKRLLSLEKAEAIRAEKALKHSAEGIFKEKFAAAGLPERLFTKIQKLVSHEQFVKEGVLDEEAFKAAVDTELKDWAGEEEGSVLGFSANSKEVHTDDKSDKLAEDTATRMAQSIGHGTKKD